MYDLVLDLNRLPQQGTRLSFRATRVPRPSLRLLAKVYDDSALPGNIEVHESSPMHLSFRMAG